MRHAGLIAALVVVAGCKSATIGRYEPPSDVVVVEECRHGAPPPPPGMMAVEDHHDADADAEAYFSDRLDRLGKDVRRGRISEDEYVERREFLTEGQPESPERDRLEKDYRRGRITKEQYVYKSRKLDSEESGD